MRYSVCIRRRGITTSTYTTEPTTGEGYTTLATRFSVAVNTDELDLVTFLTTIPADARHSTALAVRRRTIREAHRYSYAADLAVRMPDLFASFRDDGRYSVDHLEAIWARVHRYSRALAAAGVEVPATLDAAVAVGVATWINATGITALTCGASVRIDRMSPRSLLAATCLGPGSPALSAMSMQL